MKNRLDIILEEADGMSLDEIAYVQAHNAIVAASKKQDFQAILDILRSADQYGLWQSKIKDLALKKLAHLPRMIMRRFTHFGTGRCETTFDGIQFIAGRDPDGRYSFPKDAGVVEVTYWYKIPDPPSDPT